MLSFPYTVIGMWCPIPRLIVLPDFLLDISIRYDSVHVLASDQSTLNIAKQCGCFWFDNNI